MNTTQIKILAIKLHGKEYGSVSRLAKLIDYNASHLRQIIRGEKPISKKLLRAIERLQ